MKNDIRRKTCLIIRKNGEYLVSRVYGTQDLRWSIYPYDAWRTRDAEQAEEVAKAVGGITVLFNPIVNQLRVF